MTSGFFGNWRLPPSMTGVPSVVLQPSESTDLAVDESEGSVPHDVLKAMKFRRRSTSGLFGGQAASIPMRMAVGSGNATLYVIDDGDAHCAIGRRVGSAPDGHRYSLVGRVGVEVIAELTSGRRIHSSLFGVADSLVLCGVVEGDVANVLVVERYRSCEDVPVEYRPPGPYIHFPAAL